jgi:phosphomannomutase
MARSKFSDKQLIVFDLDGTLTESKSDMDISMSNHLARLLLDKKVAVIGGGNYNQFKKQFVDKLRVPKKLLKDIFLFPTTSTSFYVYRNGWRKVYSNNFSKKEKKKVIDAFNKIFKDFNYFHPSRVYGKVLEDRDSQITFSALGQDIVKKLGKEGVRQKEKWKRKNDELRSKMRHRLSRRLKEFEVRVGGLTSIDVTRKGIDKAYGIRKIRDVLGIPIKNMVFIGDAIFPGGNDYAAKKTGVDCIKVSGPEDTKKIIKLIIADRKNI